MTAPPQPDLAEIQHWLAFPQRAMGLRLLHVLRSTFRHLGEALNCFLNSDGSSTMTAEFEVT